MSDTSSIHRHGASQALTRICRHCTKPFTPERNRPESSGRNLYCSRLCATDSKKGIRPSCLENFVTPESDKAARVRANGLVNMRLRRGCIVRPDRCQRCHAICKPDSHHPDYSKPDEVVWVCRACHMQIHHNPALLEGLEPIRLNIRPDGMPVGFQVPHRKGGRKGPTGKAKGRMPLCRVLETRVAGEVATDHLLCGHYIERPNDGLDRKQRRCPLCPRMSSLPPLPAEQPQPIGGVN